MRFLVDFGAKLKNRNFSNFWGPSAYMGAGPEFGFLSGKSRFLRFGVQDPTFRPRNPLKTVFRPRFGPKGRKWPRLGQKPHFCCRKGGFSYKGPKKPKFAKVGFLPIWRARSSASVDPIELIFVQAHRLGVIEPQVNFERSPTLQRRGLGPRFWRFWALKALAHEKSRKFRFFGFWVLGFKSRENARLAF